MPATRPGRAIHAVADRQLTHGKLHAVNGLVGLVQKQDEPKSFDSAASRVLVASGVKYVLLVKGEFELDMISGATVGAPVYIKESDDTLSLAATGRIAAGRVTNIQGTFGLPTGKMRVDCDLKDNI